MSHETGREFAIQLPCSTSANLIATTTGSRRSRGYSPSSSRWSGRTGPPGLRIDYEPDPPDDRVRMWYCVDGRPWEMIPPPAELWPDIVRVLWRNARLSPADRGPWWRRRVDFPAGPVFGVLPVRYGDVVVDFDILFFRGPGGEHVWMERRDPTDVAGAAARFLRDRLGGP